MKKEKREKITVLLCSFLLLFAACDSPSNKPEIYTPIERGYGKIEIIFEKEATARTVMPSIAFDKYEYTFTKSDETTGTVITPGNDGFFILEVGSYTVAVRTYIGDEEPYTLAASGISAPFEVGPGNNTPVHVPLSRISAGTMGEFNYTITWPVGAEAEITLQKWPELTDVILNPENAPEGNGKTQTLQLEGGSYLLTVLVSKDHLYAGISEAVHINPHLSTVFSKDFVAGNLIASIPPTANNYTVKSMGTFAYNGTERTVTVERRENASLGAITILYKGQETPPINVGYYPVSINVEAARGWTMAEGLSVGYIDIHKATPTVSTWPTAATITYGGTLSSSTLSDGAANLAGTFAWTDGGTIPDVTNSGYSVTFTPNDTVNYNSVTKANVAITVNKAAGAAVNAPAETSSETYNSITISDVTAPSSGQTVEYAKNTVNSAPETGWQTSTTFGGLTESTVYYIFARSKENPNYQVGAASAGFPVTTLYVVTFRTYRDDIFLVNSYGPQSFALGSSITLPAGKTVINTTHGVTEYTYDSWNTNFNGTGTSYPTGSSITPTGNMTLYAAWSSRITFDSNNGTGTVPPSQMVFIGSSTTMPNGDGLSRAGYTFGGWSYNQDGLGGFKAGDSYTPDGNRTLYAIWLRYTVTFNINGGTGTVPVSQTVAGGQSITLPEGSGFSKSPYPFGGWNTMENGKGTNYEAGTSYIPNRDITLYARWVEYTVTFNINGGTGTVPVSQTVAAGQSITLPSGSGLSKSTNNYNYYTFWGWSTNQSSIGILFSGTTYTPTDNITLYAAWKPREPQTMYAGSWTVDSINGNTELPILFSFNVTTGTSYGIWKSDLFTPNGNMNYLASIKFDVVYPDGTIACSSSSSGSASFKANQSGKVLLRVNFGSNVVAGNFAVGYNIATSTGAIERPPWR